MIEGCLFLLCYDVGAFDCLDAWVHLLIMSAELCAQDKPVVYGRL